MKIALEEFEQHIDPAIFKRGFQYFTKGLVANVDELCRGEFEATVEGTECYTVNITLRNNVMTESVCTCPYDMGPICKHVVAVMFYLQKDILDLKPSKKSKSKENSKEKPQKKVAKPKTVTEQIAALVNKLPNEELIKFLTDSCIKDRVLRQMFFAKYEYLITPVSKELYVKQISALIKAHTSRNGWIEYSDVRKLAKEIDELIKMANEKINQGEFQIAFFIASTVVEELTSVLESADDSNGYISDSMDEGFEIFYLLIEEELSDSFHKELFDYIINSYDKAIFKSSDWHFSMLYLAVQLQRDDSEKSIIQKRIDKTKEKYDKDKREYKEAQGIELQLIEKTRGKKGSVAFMEMNLSNPDFRETLIKQAISDKLYDRAIDLAKEGIEQDKNKYAGLVAKWQEHLLDIYVITKDTKKANDWARFFLTSGSNWNGEKYYKILKKNIPTSDWQHFIDGVVAEIVKSRINWGYDSIVNIYIWEQNWEKLLHLVTSNRSLSRIEGVEMYLAPHYSAQLAELYRVEIMKFMVKNISRTHYKTVCRYLRRIIKMGERPVAQNISDELRRLYPQRRALIEELYLI